MRKLTPLPLALLGWAALLSAAALAVAASTPPSGLDSVGDSRAAKAGMQSPGASETTARKTQSPTVVPAPADVPPGQGAKIKSTLAVSGAQSPQPRAATAAPAEAMDYSLTVHGRFVYHREDGRWSGVDNCRVKVWDSDGGVDDALAETYTDADGYYSSTFTYTNGADDPDIYLVFSAVNPDVNVYYDYEYGGDGHDYTWSTGIVENYTGTDLDWGTQTISDEREMPALHLLTTATRAHRWIHDNAGFDTPCVRIVWPTDGSTHYYNDPYGLDKIYIRDSVVWYEHVLIRQYGHHWLANFAQNPTPDLCNGVCDTEEWCSSCLWCAENEEDAFIEGWAYWLADAIGRAQEDDYGLAPLYPVDVEALATCSGGYNDPLMTEGFTAALLRDIEDDEQDSHGVFGDWSDRLALGADEIFTVMHLYEPARSWHFQSRFAEQYPAYARDLWETSKNCGIDNDYGPPGVVTNLTSSHAIGSESPDRTVEFFWTNATDDLSGVAGYIITLSTAPPALPPGGTVIPTWNHYTSDILEPGTYYFCIRAIDRSEWRSNEYASYGPFTIRAADPADLEPYLATGWSRELVPRATNDATSTNVAEPTTLTGNSAATYWNVRGHNSGEVATSSGFHVGLAVDGAGLAGLSYGAVGAGVGYYSINRGPLTIRGGRHTFEAQHDDLGALSEPDEVDNLWAHQWVWTPLSLAAGTIVTRVAPPDRAGGWSSVVDGSTRYYNCDGLRFSSSGAWNAVVVRPALTADDYDCRLHAASTGAGNGFAANVGYSARGAGLTDAVLVNRNEVGVHDYDVGVIQGNIGTGNYQAVHVTSMPIAVGDSVATTLPANHMLLLRELAVTAADTGWVTVTVDVDPDLGPVYAEWFNEDFTVGDLQDYDLAVLSNVAGRARMHMHLAENGHHCLVVYRDQTCGAGTAALPLVIEVEKTLPDFEPRQVAGWHSPMVPRAVADGTPTTVAAPDTLHGNTAASYYNFAFENDSPAGWNNSANTCRATVALDGQPAVTWSYTAIDPNQIRTVNSTTARTVRGGRHTLALMVDRNATIEEVEETNNDYGEQYCWSPQGLALATPVTRAAPPDRTGGWDQIGSGETRWFNCDGLRPTTGSGYWTAVAVMPGAASDVDVRLHPKLVGAKSGFGPNFALSGWGWGQSDFVLVNFNATPLAVYDAGVLLVSGTESYTVEGVTSLYCAQRADHAYGPWTMGANRILDLREFQLTAGEWALKLDNLSGTVDWGISLHPADAAYQKKSTVVDGGAAWTNGDGQDEWFNVTIPATGYYCLAVWKARAGDLAKSGTYRLQLQAGVTGVGDTPAVPAATALVSIHPNPFNPQTRIAYDLAADGPVRLEIFDLRGKRVRTLIATAQPAGRHEAAWNGQDDSGQSVASGTYVARLVAGEARFAGKLVLLK